MLNWGTIMSFPGEELADQGCYLADPEDVPFPYKTRSSMNSHEFCIDTCREMNYKYARVQVGMAAFPVVN